MSHLRSLAGLLFVTLTVATFAADDSTRSGDSWWSRVKILADDNMEGRNTGSAGYERAAAYVAGEFERLGLRPAGAKGYLQPMPFGVRQIREDSPASNWCVTARSKRSAWATMPTSPCPLILQNMSMPPRCSSATGW